MATIGSQPSLESMGWNKDKHDATRSSIGDFWFYCTIAFHVASLLDAIIVCGVGFKAPDDEDIKGSILSQKVADVKATIEEQQEICVTVFLKSIDASGNTKNAKFLCEALEEVFAKVGEENVVQIVTDNATNYVVAGRLLMDRHPSLFWTLCSAHCLYLILEDLGKKELARLGITRFATNFITLQSLLQSKASLRCMFVSEEWTSSSYANTNAGVDVVNWIFYEHKFWLPAKEIVEVRAAFVMAHRQLTDIAVDDLESSQHSILGRIIQIDAKLLERKAGSMKVPKMDVFLSITSTTDLDSNGVIQHPVIEKQGNLSNRFDNEPLALGRELLEDVHCQPSATRGLKIKRHEENLYNNDEEGSQSA